MAKTSTTSVHDVFPTLHACSRLANDERLYDVKFCPFQRDGEDPVFAVVGEKDVIVCRLTADEEVPYDVLRWWKDESPDTSYNSLIWTRAPVNGRPWICVAGSAPKQIQIFDFVSGEHVRSLAGHGRGINDLAVSPLSSSILASAAEDYTVRLWNLEPNYAEQPCVAVFAGEGHRQPILVAQFHPNGKWMLSGGLDTAVCLWAVPELQELERDDTSEGHPEPKIIYYPHFHSTEVHANYIDTMYFYRDLIISRCAKEQSDANKNNEILLWKIDGFDPDDPPPADPPVPKPGVYTRTAFPHDRLSRGFQRLLTFKMPHTDRFYSRFSLLHAPGMRPILVMGNQMSKYYFWDLQKLEEGYDPSESVTKTKKAARGRKPAGDKAENLNRFVREQNVVHDSSPSARGSTPNASSTSVSAPPERKFDIGDPFQPLEPHYTAEPKDSLTRPVYFGTSQIAWSLDGTWMVGVGDHGVMCIFHRDRRAVGPAGAESNGQTTT